MRKFVSAAIGAATVVCLPAAGLAGAQALDSDDQQVDFTVTPMAGGGLSVMTGGPQSTLGLAGEGGTASGPLTLFSVTDTRGGRTGWTASLSLTDFTNAEAEGADIPATAATYHPPAEATGLVGGGSAPRLARDIPLSNADTPFMTRTERTHALPLEVATIPNAGTAMTVNLDGAAIGQYSATLTLSAY
ncbi:MAG TPA: WxL domain-containing protein [Candidatus Dietzia intestinigallinarum]|nr:WxL domain-containing protein [Candidatus Dietzia intestinigallinarum]